MDSSEEGVTTRILTKISELCKNGPASIYHVAFELEIKPDDLRPRLANMRRDGLIDYDFYSVWLEPEGLAFLER